MRNALILATLGLALAACGDDPCEKYVEYLCDCESAEECEDDKATYENADSDLQDECSANLDDAEEEAKTCDPDGEGDEDGDGEG